MGAIWSDKNWACSTVTPDHYLWGFCWGLVKHLRVNWCGGGSVQKSTLIDAMYSFPPWESLNSYINSTTYPFASFIKYNSFPSVKIKFRSQSTWNDYFIFCTKKSFRKIIGPKDYIWFLKGPSFSPWSTFSLEKAGNLCHIWNFWIGTEVLQFII